MPSAPHRVFQRGQAIVLIAVMLAVVVGMAALAVDGARAYALRRDMQAAVDAAALAAGDRFQQSGSYPDAEQAATAIFGQNLRTYGAPACAPAYGPPGAAPLTLRCTFPDGTALVQVISALGAAGSRFSLSASRALSLQFGAILTNGSAPVIGASASGGVNDLLYAPTLAALSQAGCGGMPGNAISVNGGGILVVQGDIVSSGAIAVTSAVDVTGDVYARCQAAIANTTFECYPSGSPPPCTFPDVAGTTRSGNRFADPNYPVPPVTAGARVAPGADVILSPGIYASDPAFSAGVCYFLPGGVYKWQGGYTNNGDFVSNELRPPDEPNPVDNTRLARRQFWNTDGVNCAGSGQVTVVAGANSVPNGTWAFVLTSTRTASYAAQSYARESGPSACYTALISSHRQNIQIQVSNVPGATGYNIYAAPSGSCGGPFGLAANLAVVGTPQNDNTGSCPVYSGGGCSLGNESITLDATILGPPFGPNALAAPGIMGSYPPTGETPGLRNNLPNDNADRAAPPAGDRANENQCDTIGGVLTTCPGPITPGAVVFYIPNGGCLNDTSHGDNVVFSGYQYNWMVLYEPGNANPPANTCSNLLGAANESAFIGLIYTPAASMSVQKASAFRTDESGGVIASTITFNGQLPTIIGNPAQYGPVPPAARLTT